MKTYQQKILRFDVNEDYINIPLFDINEELGLNYEVGNHHILPDIRWFTLIWKLHYTNPHNNDEVLGLLVSHSHEIVRDEINIGILTDTVFCSISDLRKKIKVIPFLSLSNPNAKDLNSCSQGILVALLSL